MGVRSVAASPSATEQVVRLAPGVSVPSAVAQVQREPGVAYAVPDIHRAMADARAAGLELIDAEPRMGMHGTLIAFVHPKSVGGVLTEFVQS